MKKLCIILLVVALIGTSFVYALNEGTLTVSDTEEVEAERVAWKEHIMSTYLNIGLREGREKTIEEYERKLEAQKQTYEEELEQCQYLITNLEIVLSHDYENYAWWFYEMSESQVEEFCRVVQAEGMSYRNQVAITQTAINLAIAYGNSPYYWMCQSGAYTTPTEYPLLQSTIDNVMAVFLDGARVTSRPIKYFYSYIMMPEGSKWHQQQTYVLTIDDHHFYE